VINAQAFRPMGAVVYGKRHLLYDVLFGADYAAPSGSLLGAAPSPQPTWGRLISMLAIEESTKNHTPKSTSTPCS